MSRTSTKIQPSDEAKKWLQDDSFMNFSIKMSMLSAPCQQLLFDKGNDVMHKTRSQIHVHVIKPTGTGKSTLAEQNPGISIINSYTPPAIMGTITKYGDYVPSFLNNCANKFVIFDEFDKLKGHCYQAMLNLFEKQRYGRLLGYQIKGNPIELGSLEKDGWFIKQYPTGNGYSFGVRFSALTFSAHLTKFMQEELLSRGICFRLHTTFEEIVDEFAEPESSIEFAEIKKLKYTGHVTLKNYGYELKKRKDLIKATKHWDFFNFHSGYSIRAVENIFRIAGMLARIDGRKEINAEDLAKADEYLPAMLLGYRSVSLTLREKQVLDYTIKMAKLGKEKDTTVVTLSRMLGLSREEVWRCIKKLEYVGLLEVKS